MSNVGKCPKCEKTLDKIHIESIDVIVRSLPKWPGISYVCPFCDSIISVGIDPIALKNEIAEKIKKEE